MYFLVITGQRAREGEHRESARERKRDHLCIKTIASHSERALSSRMPSVGGGGGGREAAGTSALVSKLQASHHHLLHCYYVRCCSSVTISKIVVVITVSGRGVDSFYRCCVVMSWVDCGCPLGLVGCGGCGEGVWVLYAVLDLPSSSLIAEEGERVTELSQKNWLNEI